MQLLNETNQLIDPTQKEDKLVEIHNINKQLDQIFTSSRQWQAQILPWKPIA